ncbi:type II toxin-antitoxin system HicA family toxin [Clostridium thermobutyricum]|uniref:type II toxin-antitoxin system HicA family toxin n=1 Tax=Clostridium thermobutyricum TaxID=29372 RepID=UPI0018A96C97|nr:type II toxin-antitoxin system HicA family toxin [Clostridium thermobutyricum]
MLTKEERQCLINFNNNYDDIVSDLIEETINLVDKIVEEYLNLINEKREEHIEVVYKNNIDRDNINISNRIFIEDILRRDEELSIILRNLVYKLDSFTIAEGDKFHNRVQSLIDINVVNSSINFRKVINLLVTSRGINSSKLLNEIINESFNEMKEFAVLMLDNQLILYLSKIKDLVPDKRKKNIEYILIKFNEYRLKTNYIEEIFKILIKKDFENIENIYEEIENKIEKKNNYNKEKILTYKELNKLAENKGYKLSRYNGDHAIFTKENSNSIPIPQRNMSRYLSKAILNSL